MTPERQIKELYAEIDQLKQQLVGKDVLPHVIVCYRLDEEGLMTAQLFDHQQEREARAFVNEIRNRKPDMHEAHIFRGKKIVGHGPVNVVDCAPPEHDAESLPGQWTVP